jgi:hypothetical protein
MTDDTNVQRQPRTKTISNYEIYEQFPRLINMDSITREQKELLEHYEKQKDVCQNLLERRTALLALVETAEKQLETMQKEYRAIDELFTKAYYTFVGLERNSLISPLFKEGRKIIMEEEKKKMIESVRAFEEEQRLRRWAEIKHMECELENERK